MRYLIAFGLVALPAAAHASDRAHLLIGRFTNEEQVYFDKEAGRKGPPWTALAITRSGNQLLITQPDAFGAEQGVPHQARIRHEGKAIVLDYADCQRRYTPKGEALVASGQRGVCNAGPAITRVSSFAIEMTMPDGSIAEMRRARPVSCWVAIRKTRPKADGGEDWHFTRGVSLHDQGGRALVGANTDDVQPVVIRVRNVTWDKGSTNKPVVALYIHKPDNPGHAESYSWAAPNSDRVGINLRWVQTGCTIGDAPASLLSDQKFKDREGTKK